MIGIKKSLMLIKSAKEGRQIMSHIAEHIAQNALCIGRKKRTAPCLNCKDRKVNYDYNCHTDCKRYLEYVDAEVRP